MVTNVCFLVKYLILRILKKKFYFFILYLGYIVLFLGYIIGF